jgi:ATP-dependent Clp protease ATP-binding subunit ClpA
MVYGQETLLRFDCAEFRQDHAVARLLGAPPGYVGYDKGGELTEAVRAKPNSVILFDEIEKAHPRLWDVFLSILSDGRLTNGSGETADFSQSVIIFTSNLGMYKEQSDGVGGIHRTPRFSYETPFETIQTEVRAAIKDEFVNKLGRPEILGRLGGQQSVIVFDFLRDLHGVITKFINNLKDRCRRLHDMELEVTPALLEALVSIIKNKPEALLLGGRGLATNMDRLLVDPLAAYLFDTEPVSKRLRVDWQQEHAHFEPMS